VIHVVGYCLGLSRLPIQPKKGLGSLKNGGYSGGVGDATFVPKVTGGNLLS